MIEEDATRSRIRFLIETGDLPCDETGRIWAGHGDGKHCAACLERIAATDVEFEVDLASGRTVRFHRDCHDLWLEECDPATTDTRH